MSFKLKSSKLKHRGLEYLILHEMNLEYMSLLFLLLNLHIRMVLNSI